MAHQVFNGSDGWIGCLQGMMCLFVPLKHFSFVVNKRNSNTESKKHTIDPSSIILNHLENFCN